MPALVKGQADIVCAGAGSRGPTGVGVNALIGADPGPPNGGAVFHDSAVWVKRLA